MQTIVGFLLLLAEFSPLVISLQPRAALPYANPIVKQRQAVDLMEDAANMGQMINRKAQSPWQ